MVYILALEASQSNPIDTLRRDLRRFQLLMASPEGLAATATVETTAEAQTPEL